MAITHVASAAGSTPNPTTSDQVTLSASIQADDVILVVVHNRYADQGVVLTGVTDNDTGGNTWAKKGESANGRLSVWWKVATSGTASKTVTATIAEEAAVIMGYSAYRGADTTDPITNLVFEENASGNETMAGFTPANADSWVFLAVGIMDNLTTSSQSTTSPGALTERFDKTSTAQQDHALSLASAAQVGGPTATGNFTWAQTNFISDSGAWALKPAGAAGTVHDLDGTIAGIATLAATLERARNITGSIAGTGALTGAMGRIARLSGSVAGTGALSGTLVRLVNLDGSVAGLGLLEGDVRVFKGLTGSIAGTSTLAGTLGHTANLSGQVAGAGALSGDLIRRILLSGSIPSSGALTGDLQRVRNLTGTVAGLGTLTGDLRTFAIHSLSGDIIGVAQLQGDMLVVHGLSGAIEGQGTLEAELQRVHNLVGEVAATSLVIGYINLVLPIPSAMDYRSVLRFRPRGRI